MTAKFHRNPFQIPGILLALILSFFSVVDCYGQAVIIKKELFTTADLLEISFIDAGTVVLDRDQTVILQRILNDALEDTLQSEDIEVVNHRLPALVISVLSKKDQTVVLARIPILSKFCKKGKEGWDQLWKDLRSKFAAKKAGPKERRMRCFRKKSRLAHVRQNGSLAG